VTRALRRRHRMAIAILAVALPTGVAIALAVRPVLPPIASRDPLAGAPVKPAAAREGAAGKPTGAHAAAADARHTRVAAATTRHGAEATR
jgi:hypothetical protein